MVDKAEAYASKLMMGRVSIVRNRRMLIKSGESPSSSDEPWDAFQSVSQPAAGCDTATTTPTPSILSTTVDTTTNTTKNITSNTISRSGLQRISKGRIIGKPARFSDYIMDQYIRTARYIFGQN